MKKRLLALALCLVMMTSLLPLTAAADSPLVLKSVTLKASGVEQRSDGLYYVNITSAIGTYDGGETDIKPHLRELSCCLRFLNTGDGINMPPEKGITYRLDLNFQVSPTSVTLENAKIPVKLEILGYATECHWCLPNSAGFQSCFYLTKVHEHDWRFTVSESGDSLTSKCLDSNCFIEPVTLSLSAHSVTLPDSPFNAQLAGEKEFQAAFPNAAISKIRYDYKGSDGVWHKGVDPVAANAKAGEYQAFVEISSLPGTVVDESGNILNQNGEGYLYVKYTAVDPKVTAQTGDNRPIELMMAGVVLFSALAAAAFILDSKRKNASL